MALLRRTLLLLSGRKAKASREGTPGSHVNKRKNKRIASKAARQIDPYDGQWTEYCSCHKDDEFLR